MRGHVSPWWYSWCMSSQHFVPPADRSEMVRAFAGLLTAKVANDPRAADAQLKSIIRDQAEASGGDLEVFAVRMAKQVEAGAIVAWTILRSLAPRLGLTEFETQRVLAEVFAVHDLAPD